MRSDEFRRIAWDAGFEDRDIEPLHEEALHYLYDDIIPHYLRSWRRLDAPARHMLARVVLFLQTDQRYEPVDDDELTTAFGGSGIWPFTTNKEFAAAKATPRYLTGRNDRTPELTHAH